MTDGASAYQPLIVTDSPIRVRANLDRCQAAQLDAIAVAANVIDLTYVRLAETLADLPPDGSIEIVLADAWASSTGSTGWTASWSAAAGCRSA